MFVSNCTPNVPYEREMHKYLNPEYANVRCINMDEFNNYNRINIYNATFLDDGKYYNPVNINNISEKEAIMKMYEREKCFGKEENEALKTIINKIAVKTQNNIFDYYD